MAESLSPTHINEIDEEKTLKDMLPINKALFESEDDHQDIISDLERYENGHEDISESNENANSETKPRPSPAENSKFPPSRNLKKTGYDDVSLSSSSSVRTGIDLNLNSEQGSLNSQLDEIQCNHKSQFLIDELLLADEFNLHPELRNAIIDAGLSELSDSSFENDDVYVDVDDILDSSWANSLSENQDIENDLDFPHRAKRRMECDICFETYHLRRRMCCDFQICNNCLSTYISAKVKEGKVQIECPNDRCNILIYREEIRYRLPLDLREKFMKFLIDANQNPLIKTCPSCSIPYEIDPAKLKVKKKKLKQGVEVTCVQCRLIWCFRCQAPFHTGMTCKKYKNEDEMVKRWAKGMQNFGNVNAQKCPKCKVFVQKRDGCDHMKCTQCNTNFCYKCGDRYLSVRFFGNHWSRFSLFGCRYRLMPEKNGLRRLIRGSHFAGRLFAAVVLAGLGVAAGALLLAGSVIILPGCGIVRLRRRIWAARQRKKFIRRKMGMLNIAERQRSLQVDPDTEVIPFGEVLRDMMELSSQLEIEVTVHRSQDQPSSAVNNTEESSVMVNQHADGLIKQDVSAEEQEGTRNAGDDFEQSFEIYEENVFDNGSEDDNCNICQYENVTTTDAMLSEEMKMKIENDSQTNLNDNENVENNTEKENDKVEKKRKEAPEKVDFKCTENEEKECYSQFCSEKTDSEQKFEEDSISIEKCVIEIAPEIVDQKSCSLENSSPSDTQHVSSISSGKTLIYEKIIARTKLLREDKNLNLTDYGGKGCFGNIFNVGKKSNGILSPNAFPNGEIEKTNTAEKVTKLMTGSKVKKASSEKCRQMKLDIDCGLAQHCVDSCSTNSSFQSSSPTDQGAFESASSILDSVLLKAVNDERELDSEQEEKVEEADSCDGDVYLGIDPASSMNNIHQYRILCSKLKADNDIRLDEVGFASTAENKYTGDESLYVSTYL